MALLEKQLLIKKSGLTKAGKGLFTEKPIAKGTKIVEYKGLIKPLIEIKDRRYAFYVNKDHVIDAKQNKEGLAHFANDAKGLSKKADLRNNAKYLKEGVRVFIVATKQINAGEEILVGYGKSYWEATPDAKNGGKGILLGKSGKTGG
jgi:hypothetical protein